MGRMAIPSSQLQNDPMTFPSDAVEKHMATRRNGHPHSHTHVHRIEMCTFKEKKKQKYSYRPSLSNASMEVLGGQRCCRGDSVVRHL